MGGIQLQLKTGISASRSILVPLLNSSIDLGATAELDMTVENTAFGFNSTVRDQLLSAAGMSSSMDKERLVVRIASGLATILLTLLLTKLWARYVNPWLQCLSKEKRLAKQGVPIVSGMSFFEGHGHLERQMKEEAESRGPNTQDPHNIASRIEPFHDFCVKKYGKTFVYRKGREVTLHTQDPEVVKEMLVTQVKDFHKNELVKQQLEALIGRHGIVIAEGTAWAHQRILVSPAFRAEKLKEMVKPMMISVNTIMEKWEKSIEEGGNTAEIDVAEDIGFITGDILSRTAFGAIYEKGAQYLEMLLEVIVHTQQQYVSLTMPNLSFIPTARNRRVWKLEKQIKALVEDILLEARRSASKEGSYGDDLLGLMLEASDGLEPKYRLTNEELIDQMKTFFFAGQETSSVLLRWTMMLLATHLDWQEKAYEEVERCCVGKPLDFESAGKLRVMNMIFNETLRLYPPAVWMQRVSTKDSQLGKLLVPKDTTIYLNVLNMHTNPDLWGPDSYAFNPERFADGISKAVKHPQAYIPFSTGPRYCVGQPFAWLEAKLVLATILQNFSFRISPNYVHLPVDRVGPKPKDGIQILFSKR